MRSGTSFFDKTIYRKTVNRFWPLWAVNLVIWFMVLPMQALISTRNGDDAIQRFARLVGQYVELGLVFAIIMSLAAAMAACSHLYHSRSANFMAALPCRREGQFLSTWLAGLTLLIGPNVVIFLLTALIQTAGGVASMGGAAYLPLVYWLVMISAAEFFFYSFAVCLGQFTGHILALPVYYAIFNAIVPAVYFLLDWIMHIYYFGFVSMGDVGEDVVMWFTPVAQFFRPTIRTGSWNVSPVVKIYELWVVAVYAAAAVVLTACALLLYRRRHMETAGDIVAVRVMRPVFKYGVALCSGLFLGFLTEQMFSLGEVGLVIALVVWGVVGCFVAQMLLDKTVRVFRKWKGPAAVALVFVALCLMVSFDLTGFERRVPSANSVARVTISGLEDERWTDDGYRLQDVTLTETEDIQKVIALHEEIVTLGERGDLENDYGNHSFQVSYVLNSGLTLKRSYRVPFGERLSPLAQAVRDLDAVRRQAYGLDEVAVWLAEGGELDSVTWMRYVNGGWESREMKVDSQGEQALWDAVMADFEARRIGAHTVGGKLLNSGREERLSFQFRIPAEVYRLPSYPDTQEYYEGDLAYPADPESGWRYDTVEICIQDQSTATRAAMKEYEWAVSQEGK